MPNFGPGLTTTLNVSPEGNLITTNLLLEAASGDLAGFNTVNKFGRNPDIDSAFEDIWAGGTAWVPPTQGRIHDIVSTDTNDTSAGTGARTVRVIGLDNLGVSLTETVTLNGTTDVPTVGLFSIVFRMQVVTAGSGAANAGAISATAQTDSTLQAVISIGDNQTLQAFYQIPAGFRGFLFSYYASMNRAQTSGASDAKLLIKPSDEVYQTRHFLSISNAGLSYFNHLFEAPLIIDPLSIIKIQADASAMNTDVSGGFNILLVEQN